MFLTPNLLIDKYLDSISLTAHFNAVIALVGSVTTIMGLPDVTAYATSKTALSGLARTLAIELGKYSINVNCICPGFIQTDIFKRVRKKDPNRFKKILSRTPLDRFGKVEDISNVVGFTTRRIRSPVNALSVFLGAIIAPCAVPPD